MIENVNAAIGKKIRARRLIMGMSQSMVATGLNITFQQIQKYENGKNGLSAERLLQISRFLGVPVSYFFEGLTSETSLETNNLSENEIPYQTARHTDVIKMSNAFSSITSTSVRSQLLGLAQAFAKKPSESK